MSDNETSLNFFLQTAQIVLAARLRARVLLHHNATKRFAPGKKEGGEAPKGACQPLPRTPTSVAAR
jgi:hypothetical protein